MVVCNWPTDDGDAALGRSYSATGLSPYQNQGNIVGPGALRTGADVQNIPMMGLVWGSLFDNDAHETQEDCWLMTMMVAMTGRWMIAR